MYLITLPIQTVTTASTLPINSITYWTNIKDGTSPAAAGVIEQRAFAAFLKQHANIRAYLHGHVHESKFYIWTGPDNDVSLDAASADITEVVPPFFV